MVTYGKIECVEHSSYQHIQGVMLQNLNIVASELRLTHTEYRVMAILIGLWNKKHLKAFPTTDYLAKHCCMGKQTIIKTLKSLVNSGLLVVVKSFNNRNNYYFTNQIINTKSSIQTIPEASISCNTAHDKNIKNIKQIKKTSKKLKQKEINYFNNDELNYNSSEEKLKDAISLQLKKWSFCNPEKVFKDRSITELKRLIDFTKKQSPENPGAYLRTLLKTSQPFLEKQKAQNVSSGNIILDKLLKHTYWEHIPTKKIFQALPDQGNHLLFHYNNERKEVYFFDEDFSDNISKFKPSIKNDFQIQRHSKNVYRPSKEEILAQLYEKGNIEEALYLKKCWKMAI